MLTRISAGKARGTFTAPPSKSMAHRLLICSGLAQGRSVVDNVSFSNDILATIDCLNALGVKTTAYESSVETENCGRYQTDCRLDCRESGSTLRFFIPIILALGVRPVFTGSRKLLSRPLDEYEKICRENGIVFSKSDSELRLEGKLKPGTFVISSEISSQFASGLIFALPLLDGNSRIVFEGKINSRSYIDMTLNAVNSFGISAEWTEEAVICIKGNQFYSSRNSVVEGDYSNAAFFEAMNCLGSDIRIEGLKEDSLQGDKIYKKYFDEMKKGFCELDITDCPDLAPVLMALGGALNGVRLSGTSRLKAKESDRGEVMKTELGKFGIRCAVYDDEIVVEKSDVRTPVEAIDSHNDHRIAMAASVLMTLTGGVIKDSQSVNKSFPGFFEELEKLGIGAETVETD